MSLSGHFWTVGDHLSRMVVSSQAPPSETWEATLEDSRVGEVELSGRLSRPPGARDLVILVHGLGGSSDSTYMKGAATTAGALGLASLRLNLRGADGETGDFYHGGLTADVAAAIEDLRPAFSRVTVLGFSLGGHIAMRLATEPWGASVAAFAAVCSPLDLAAAADSIDRPLMAPYRAYMLRRLKANYARTARFGNAPTAAEKVLEVDTIRRWDSLTVVPRFGFQDTDDYYSQASVGPRLDRLRRPALLVATEHDPMVPPGAISPHLGSADQLSRLTVRWLRRGGHVAIPRRADLGLDGVEWLRSDPSYMAQILGWLQQVGD